MEWGVWSVGKTPECSGGTPDSTANGAPVSERRDQRLDGVSAGPVGQSTGRGARRRRPGRTAHAAPGSLAEPAGDGLAAFAFSDMHEHQLTVRAFVPGVGVAEDPVTGRANALTAAMLAAQGDCRAMTGAASPTRDANWPETAASSAW
ncbi:PhzF family phenazine biosynthesis protein [Xanthomonas sp. PPL568]|uniref:PhzF family phenazine biosynthesis protein n=1 Tax=Xanthomonas indica TaxID=2912242 RepID=UPI001F599A40|nr:PhzF family phenazine biosynthesis protein [Xanthomonas indica]MCI2244068.1 PhzF family phenazine biosynthesis protein [Xanthomonas indica]